MSPENEGPNTNTQSILEIDLNNTKNKNWLSTMHPTSGQNNEVVDRHRNGKSQNGNGTHNGTSNRNGNATNGYATNGNGTTNDLNGNARRNSSHVWSPLLQTDSTLPDPTTMLYSPSNNNEWKDSEEINNLKNGRHIVPSTIEKNGLVHSEKYSEQDPLTGLYSPQIIPKRSNDFSDDEEVGFPEVDSTSGCGLFGYRPNWARNLDSTNVFVVFFLLAWVLQGMFMTYFVSVITTIEKLFQIKSRTTGLLLSASEMGQICTALLLTYFAGRGHRPRWIACGMVIFAIASFSCSLPHFIFGKDLMQSALINGMTNIGSGNGGSGVTLSSQPLLFNSTDFLTSSGHMISSKNSDNSMNLCLANNSATYESSEECEEDVKLEQASHSKITVIVLCIFFVSLVSSGIGQTAVTTLGIPYIDDNVDRSQSAMYLAITIGVRILGPTIGFLLGSFCTRWYVDFTSPGFDATDSRWIGAWWLGPIIIGVLMVLGSIAMFSFPRELRKRHEKGTPLRRSAPKPLEASPKLRDFPKTVRRQLSNDILMFRTASCVFHLLPIAGLTTFLPKYLETQFRLAASDANMIAAFGGILIMGIGIIIAGIVFIKKQPSAKIVSGWIAMTSFVYASGMVVLMFIGCNMNDFAGLKLGSSQTSVIFEPTCNLTCACDLEKFAPICGSDGRTYFSSCHAGCSSYEVHGNKTMYSNCDCIPDVPFEEAAYEATNGYCDSSCKNFIVFLVIFATIVFVHSTSEVGSMLLVMRCTDPGDKSMAMGVIQSAIGLFGNVPCPIIYGAVVDSACLVWKTVCGKHGACSLYNVEAFRHNYLGITAGIMFLAFIMDLVVYSKAHRIDLMAERETKEDAECEKPITGSDTTV